MAAKLVVTKKQALKLKPGTWLEVRWNDAPNEIGLLLEIVPNTRGEVDLRMFWANRKRDVVDKHAMHTQITRVIGPVQVPV